LRQHLASAYPANEAAHLNDTKGLFMHYVWMAVIGFIVGLVARAILPGTQSLGIILTAVLGIAGSFVAGFAGQALGLYTQGDPVGFIASVIGAIVLLFIVGKLKGSSS
jgi:uncharacterized membrane protein YeaQ/YmgE (transglycosylase-associated protein family)